ncbi:hypothetical protein [Saprospira grandis]|uniref:hypothetical protein n=1 Tax=Saprospira grandis TaxID=1008 RepID=UPI0012DC305F|nr:hypothetical protein [Saprospira grandis]
MDVSHGVRDVPNGVCGPISWGLWTYLMGFVDVSHGVQDVPNGVCGPISWSSGRTQ